MHYSAFLKGELMSERKSYDQKLIEIGELLSNKRKSLGKKYENRESFIQCRSTELFGGEDWISLRHLSNIELGKNWISIEKLIILAAALEENPVELFQKIIQIYQKS